MANKNAFWAFYILYFILALAAIIISGMVFRGGYKSKGTIWTLYSFSILFFLAANIALVYDQRIWASLALIIQLILLAIPLVITNRVGNVVAIDPLQQYATTGKYTVAVLLTVVSFLFGVAAVYFDKKY